MKNLIAIFSLVFFSCNSSTTADKPAPAPASIYKAASLPTPNHKAVRIYNPNILRPIEKMISVLEGGTYDYAWSDNTSCNIGMLAQIVAGISKKELEEKCNLDYKDYDKYRKRQDSINGHKSAYDGSWRNLINYYCGVTGRSMHGIVSDLNKAGFSNDDIIHLEWLNDKYILSKAGINTDGQYYANKDNLIAYLKTWDSIIKNQENTIAQ